MLTFNEWQKLDIRIGRIKEIKDHPEADKLYILKIDIGKEIQLVAGLKQHYKKEELLNKKIVVLTNLEPKKLRGVESQGMLLAADNGKGIISILIPDKDIEIGSVIR